MGGVLLGLQGNAQIKWCCSPTWRCVNASDFEIVYAPIKSILIYKHLSFILI